MSKYYKAEDVIRVIDDAFDGIPMEQTIEILQARRKIRNLPIIEVSEVCISRADAIKAIESQHTSGSIAEIQRIFDADPHSSKTDFEDTLLGIFYAIQDAPSVIPAQPDIEYILSQLADLLDEYSELDENGLHDPKWCGVNEAYLIVSSASPKPKEGEWVKVDDSVQPICSKCGISCSGIHRNADYSVVPTWKYCPNCGAKMRGAER